MQRAMNLLTVTIFQCGDVMTGRGIDQALPYPSPPVIYEPYVTDAREYVRFAEKASSPIPKPIGFTAVWGDAIAELDRHAPDVRLINLETAVTKSEDYWKGKGINYRMNPANAPVLSAAGINVATLANNHVLDWGHTGLAETVETLKKHRIRCAGAGKDRNEAETPAIVAVGGRSRVVVFSFAAVTSGVPDAWAATSVRPGVNILPDLSRDTIQRIRDQVRQVKRQGDIIIASIHWGPNWGYGISADETRFSRGLIDEAGVDIIHGHSSHHSKAIEVYHGRLILYGCGDLLNDYEGISGHDAFRGDLGLMYFARVDPATGKLLSLDMTPTQVRHFRVNRASPADARWIADVLNREGRDHGTSVVVVDGNRLQLKWKE
ncbi:MAG: CapA family protein [Nitrospirae bacterium]|nr:CapA family protein [Nitrospirota bacterium]